MVRHQDEINLDRLLTRLEKTVSVGLSPKEKDKTVYNLKTAQTLFDAVVRLQDSALVSDQFRPDPERVTAYRTRLDALHHVVAPALPLSPPPAVTSAHTDEVGASTTTLVDGVAAPTPAAAAPTPAAADAAAPSSVSVPASLAEARAELFALSGAGVLDAGVEDESESEELAAARDALAEDMADLAAELKRRTESMGALLRNDNETLSNIHDLQETNRAKLDQENAALQQSLRSTWSFTLMLWLLLLSVGGIFFFTYAVIRLFPLR